jgi:hypothetical protein
MERTSALSAHHMLHLAGALPAVGLLTGRRAGAGDAAASRGGEGDGSPGATRSRRSHGGPWRRRWSEPKNLGLGVGGADAGEKKLPWEGLEGSSGRRRTGGGGRDCLAAELIWSAATAGTLTSSSPLSPVAGAPASGSSGGTKDLKSGDGCDRRAAMVAALRSSSPPQAALLHICSPQESNDGSTRGLSENRSCPRVTVR